MTISPMLASDTTAAFLGFAVIVLIMVTAGFGFLLGSAAIALNWSISRRKWWGLLLALAPVPLAGAALLLSISIQGEPTIAGFPNRVLIPVSTAPLFCVPFSLLLWTRTAMPRK
jgi:hypothetical protein